eukprot:3984897-Pyramimonas_sp.AAC.1
MSTYSASRCGTRCGSVRTFGLSNNRTCRPAPGPQIPPNTHLRGGGGVPNRDTNVDALHIVEALSLVTRHAPLHK